MSRAAWITGLLLASYLGLALLGTAWGTAAVGSGQAVRCLAAGIGLGDDADVPATVRFVVLHVRLPQMLLLGLVGAALACAGGALQATFENPLADPSVLGVTGGAALGAVLAIHTGLAENVFLALPLSGFLGALAAGLAVYCLTYLSGRPTVHTLLLIGVAVGSICMAGISLVMVLSQQHRLQELLFWLVGGVRNQTWEHVGFAAPAIVPGCVLLVSLHRRLDALLLGEEQALAVGVPAAGTRLLVLGLAALVTGAATAVSGSIAFVGLMVPHMLRRLTGARAIDLLPACLTGGAAFLTACELLARTMSGPVPVQLGILTAFLGGLFFLVLLRKGEQGTCAPWYGYQSGKGYYTRGLTPPVRLRQLRMTPPLLQTRHVTVRRGERLLLDGLSVTLQPGSMTVLLGPNGAGKTTLMRVLAGVLPPTAGEVCLEERRLDDLGRRAIARQCAYLPQQTATAFEIRVEDAVMLGRYPHIGAWGRLRRDDFERVGWALERVGVAGLRGRLLPTLSGGERQRVFLARALAQEAPILLLDEPTAALDIGHQLELMGLLAELHREGRTILAALHDLRPALEFFPRALLLNNGRLCADGPTREVILGPALEAAFGVRVERGEDWCFRRVV
jgi:ABC-type cobalamin/Fe3+-siderophores transport system ATPase subunit/ABC-type Fe3+-siderophore transport system permease subunit